MSIIEVLSWMWDAFVELVRSLVLDVLVVIEVLREDAPLVRGHDAAGDPAEARM